VGLWLICEVPRSHSLELWMSDELVAETQQSLETDIHVSGGIRICNPRQAYTHALDNAVDWM
jgi:hypothetical protein